MDIGLAELSIGVVANNALTATVTWFLTRRQYRATASVTEAQASIDNAEAVKKWNEITNGVLEDQKNLMAAMREENAAMRERERIYVEKIEGLERKVKDLEQHVERVSKQFPCDNCPSR